MSDVDHSITGPSGRVLVRRLIAGGLGISLCTLLFLYLFPLALPSTLERRVVESLLEQIIDRPVQVAGKTSLAFIPSISISAREVSIPSAAGEDQPVLADIGSIRLRLDTLGLLTDAVIVEQLLIDRPIVRLFRSEDGRANWQIPGIEPHGRSGLEPDLDWGKWQRFQVGTVQLTDGRVVIDDRLADQRILGTNARLGVRMSRVTGSDDGLSVDGHIDINGRPVRLRLDLGSMEGLVRGGRTPIIAEASAAPLTARYHGTLAKRQFLVSDGRVLLDAPDVAALERWIGPVFSGAVSGVLHWTSALKLNGSRVDLDGIRLDLGNGRYAGRVLLDRSTDGGRLTADIAATQIDLLAFSRLMPGFWTSQNIESRLNLKWERLVAGRLSLGSGELAGKATSNRNMMTLNLRGVEAYGGRVDGQMVITRGEGMTSLDANAELSRVSSGDVLSALGMDSYVQGVANLRLGLFSVGGDARELLAALRGHGEFNAMDGVLLSPGLAAHLKTPDPTQVNFSQLIGSFSIDRGILEGRDLLLKSPAVSLIGDGVIDLSGGEVDIHLQSLTRMPKDIDGNSPKVRPLRMLGTLAEIDILGGDG